MFIQISFFREEGGARVNAKAFVRIALGWASVLLPLDALLMWFQHAAGLLARGVFARDWRLQAFGRPQFFKHQINLSRWTSEPFRWSFSARGVYARQNMFKACSVLDLCCGDGSYSFLFFSDIAGHIDAVDNDSLAIDYAMKYRAAPVISYHQLDVLSEPLPNTAYDVVVWNAAICYFSEKEIRTVLQKIANAGKRTMQLSGMLPRANGHPDHKTEFADRASVALLLQQFFRTVQVREVDEGPAVAFYFQASDPLQRD
jgi:SAM-dependent methyltransferase